jgi:uncharacterized protein YyaL (SSP411 family)
MLGNADMLINGAVELAIVGEPASNAFRALVRAAAGEYVPSLVIAGGPPRGDNEIALLTDRDTRGGDAAAYVCRGYSCDEPATTPELLASQLAGAGAGARSAP